MNITANRLGGGCRPGTWKIDMDERLGAKFKKEYICDGNDERIRLPSGEWKVEHTKLTDEKYSLCDEYY